MGSSQEKRCYREASCREMAHYHSGYQPSSMPDQPHDCSIFQQQTTADSRLQSQLVWLKESTVYLTASFHWSLALMTVAIRVLAEFDALWRSLLTSPAISLLVHHPRATQHQCGPTFPAFAPQHQLSPQKSFVDCIAITAPVERS